MKTLIQAVAVAVAIAAPLSSFAQSNAPVTRAQVRAELVQIEQAGYHPAPGRDPYYPQDIQAAEARVAAQHSAIVNTSYGASTNGSSQSGNSDVTSQSRLGSQSLFFGGR